MNLRTASPNSKTDKRKIALIPVLAGFLIWNLTSAGGNAHGDAAVDFVEQSEQTLTEAEGLIRQLRQSQDRASQKNWPQFNLNDVVKFDPFSLAGTLAERSGVLAAEQLLAAQTETGLDLSVDTVVKEPDPSENPVRAVTIGRNGAAALIDSRIVRVGDELEEGIRIVAIERNAIVVEMID